MISSKNFSLDIHGLSVHYDDRAVFESLDLQVGSDELLCLLGPSGCGKSTLLRAIAGFQPIATGEIKLRDRVLVNEKVSIPAEQRHIGMMFQDIALFPHLNVVENLEFGLFNLSASDRSQRVNELIRRVGLSGLEQRYPHQLSGGQQQRVALARAIAPKPSILLLDEPFSGLDASLREELVPEIAQLLKREGIGAILVTHDQTEAFSFADKIAVMHKGTLVQVAAPYEIYHQPKTKFVAKFTGGGSLLELDKSNAMHAKLVSGVISTAQFETASTLFIRPEEIVIDSESEVKGVISQR
ncbi:MAG: hypothetical protein RL143_1070, partial [Pseudomonadota bacterium]